MLQTRPRLSDGARRVLRASMIRSVGAGGDVSAQTAQHAAVQALLVRFRGLAEIDELVELYHFQRGTLTRWAAMELRDGGGLSSVAAIDAAVRLRLA